MNQNIHISNLPDLLEVQRSSFCWFLNEGLAQELAKISSIVDTKKTLEFRFYGQEYKLQKPELSIFLTKERKTTYSVKLYVPIEIIDKSIPNDINIIEKQNVFLGEIPLMTDKATFIVNGCERVVLNQIIKSPGIYYKKEKPKNIYFKVETQKKRIKKTFNENYSCTIITNHGSWLTFDLDCELIWLRIDKKYNIPINLFLAALNLSNEEIYQSIKNSDFLMKSITNIKKALEKQKEKDEERKEKEKSGVLLPKRKKTIDLVDVVQIRKLICLRILNPKYYDLGEVGRVRINKKLGLHLSLGIRTLTPQDILKSIDYLIDIRLHNGEIDDIDSLMNRRVRCVGELVQVQIRHGLSRLEKTLNERFASADLNVSNPHTLVNPNLIIGVMKEFFGSSPLAQFMDETNPLSELTHKRRISALGPGGLNTDHVVVAVRDIHPTQYGRLCPIETPEGQNAGLIASLASHAKINKYGFIESPFFKVFQAKVLKETSPIYLNAEQERLYKIAPADISLTTTNSFNKDFIPVRYNQEFTLVPSYEVELVAISPVQIISAAAALIPFLEHDDANRALMGSNMQRQAVPLLFPQKPIVGTGLEAQIATDSYTGLINYCDGIVRKVTANQILVINRKKESIEKSRKIKTKKRKLLPTEYKRYKLEKYRRSNQGTCVNQKPIVWPGQYVQSGQLLADGPGTDGGELALGQNLTVAYMPWEGYNYEDAILVSERLVSRDLFTSIHIEKYEIEVRQTKAGDEEMTSNLPYTNDYSIRNLSTNGLIYKGAYVEPGDILVGKVTPKGETDLLPERRLLNAIFGEKAVDVNDTSLRVPKGIQGRVIDVLVFTKENGDDLPLGTIHLVQVFIAEVRKIKIGDKIAGRHGNKGIISKIMPLRDMPYLPDGTIIDIIFNPLGVPSRMNVGQLFETLLGLAGDKLNKRFKILPFDEMFSVEASRILINKKLKEAASQTKKPWLFNPDCPGKIILRDGRTGESFDNPVVVGKSYILKLIHLVDDKMHARATGPYSLITQQPLGGKSQQGGQRFGEMEVWALEAFGAAYTLQELLTLKSDDIEGRNDVMTAIIKGIAIPKPGIPESFKVLLRELQALGLDITTYKLKKSTTGQTQAVEVNLMASTLPYNL